VEEFLQKYGPFDYIIGSDLVYGHEFATFQLLISTLNILASSSTKILLAYKKRYEIESFFFKEIQKYFELKQVPPSELTQEYQNIDSPISIFQLNRR